MDDYKELRKAFFMDEYEINSRRAQLLMDDYNVGKLCSRALHAVVDKGDFQLAEELLSQAEQVANSTEFPTEGSGHLGRELVAQCRRTLHEYNRGLQRRAWPCVFLSHSHADKPFVRALAKSLRENNIDVWVDAAEIKFGDSLIDKLRTALDSVAYVIAVLSPSSIDSHWVKKELDIAMTREIESRRLTVIPVIRSVVELPSFLKGKFYAEFTTPHKRRTNRAMLAAHILEHWNSRNA